MTLIDAVKSCLNAIAQDKLRTFIPLLSIFSLKGKPLTLDLHYQFAPMFNTIYPRQQVWMTGRQVGKTYQIAQSSVLRSSLIPFYDILHIEPRDEQRTRYHTTILKPLLESSPICGSLIKKVQLSKTLLKQFNVGSFMYLGTAYANADALRGLSGCSQIVIDELADVDFSFVPVIREVMSANLRHGYSMYAGTPTTTDTTCGILWDKSSQAQWIIRCTHCNHFNIPNPQHDLLGMLGKNGLVCSRCGRTVFPHNGGFVHAVPQRQFTFPGYHIGQPIHPLHLTIDQATNEPRKWYDLLAKVDSYSKLRVYNEVFGWPYDQSVNPLTLRDLVAAQHDYSIASIQDIPGIRHMYRCIAIGVDWDGGGAVSQSFTTACVAGLRTDTDRIDILFGKRYPKGTTPTQQAQQLMQWIDILHPDIFAHDNGGAGFVRMQIMKQRGLLLTSTYPVPFTYTGPKKGDIISYDKAQQQADYYNYTIDKSRSLALIVQALKDTSVRIMKFNVQDKTQLAYDFLALKQDPRAYIGNRTVVFIGKKPGVPDDFAHAVNFACSALWHKFGIFPVLGQKFDTSVLAAQYQNFSPRSQFSQFVQAVSSHPVVIDPQEDVYESY